MRSRPSPSWPARPRAAGGGGGRPVRPGAILYDLLLAPLAFLLVSRVTRGIAPERAPAPEFSRAQRLASVFRQASAGAAPNLRLAGTGGSHQNPSPARPGPELRPSGGRSPSRAAPTLRLAGTGGSHQNPSPARRVPKLRLSGAGSPSSARTAAAVTPGAPF